MQSKISQTRVLKKNTVYISIAYFFFFILLSPLIVFAEENAEDIALKLHKYSNKKLLNTAKSELDKATAQYYPTLRAIAQDEHQLEQVNKQIKQLNTQIKKNSNALTKLKTKHKKSSQSEVSLIEHSIEILNKTEKLSLMLVEKEGLLKQKKHYLDSLEIFIRSALLYNNIVLDTLNYLDAFQIEINLRIQDKTLKEESLTNIFNKNTLTQHREVILAEYDELISKETALSIPMKKSIIEIQAIILEIQTINSQLNAVKKEIAEEQKAEIFKKTLLNKKPEYLYEKLDELDKEWTLLNSNFEKSYKDFNNVVAIQKKSKKQLATLTEPQASHPQLVHIEEAKLGVKIATDYQVYYKQRLDKLNQYKNDLNALKKQSLALEADEVLLNEHALEILSVLEVIEDKYFQNSELMPPKKVLDEHLSIEKLFVYLETMTDKLAQTLMREFEAEGELERVSKDIKETQLSLKEINVTADYLKKINTISEKQNGWTKQLATLTTEQMIEKFQSIQKRLVLEKQQQKVQQSAFDKQYAKFLHDVTQMEEVKDSVLRRIEKEEFSEKKSILETLYLWAHLPLEHKQTEIIPVTKDKEDHQPQSTKKEIYQNRIFVYTNLIDKEFKNIKIILNDLELLEKTMDQDSIVLTKLKETQLEYYVTAIALKKRLAHKQNQVIETQLKDDLVTALHSEFHKEIDKKIEETNEIRSNVRHIASTFNDKNLQKIEKEIHDSLFNLEELISSQLNLDKALIDLKEKLNIPFSKISKTKRQEIEQRALFYLNKENTFEEKIFEYIPTEKTRALLELLHSYYIDLTILKDQRKDLSLTNKNLVKLEKYSQQEEVILIKLKQQLEQQKKNLKERYEDEWIRIQILLMPEKAEQIIQQFQRKVGRHFVIPSPIAEEHKVEAIHSAADILFYLHIHMIATDKWQDILTQRLSTQGIFLDRDTYQSALATAQTLQLATNEQMQKLTGIDQTKANSVTTQSKGNISLVREQRLKLNRDNSIGLATTIFIILTIAFIISRLLNFFIKRMKGKEEANNQQKQFILSVIHAFLSFNLWVFTIISILSLFGFNVGAILAGLGIGGLALAFAIKETLSNIISGITLFLERPFRIGDTVTIGGSEPQHIIRMTWRSIILSNSMNYQTHIPNNQATNLVVVNYTKVTPTRDFIDIIVSPKYEASTVLRLAVEALDQCGDIILQNEGKDAIAMGSQAIGNTTVMRYRIRYYLADYKVRGKVRARLWLYVKNHLEDANISLKIVPYKEAFSVSETPLLEQK